MSSTRWNQSSRQKNKYRRHRRTISRAAPRLLARRLTLTLYYCTVPCSYRIRLSDGWLLFPSTTPLRRYLVVPNHAVYSLTPLHLIRQCPSLQSISSSVLLFGAFPAFSNRSGDVPDYHSPRPLTPPLPLDRYWCHPNQIADQSTTSCCV